MELKAILSADQVRQARAALQWSQGDLAKKADVAVSTIADFEKGGRVPIANNINAIREALEAAGIDFTPGGASIYGVSLYLSSESNGAEVYFRYATDGLGAVQDVLSIFGEVKGGEGSLSAVQRATPVLKVGLEELAKRYARQAPQLHQLKKFVHQLRDDEFFLILPEKLTSTAEKLECEDFLHRLNHPDEPSHGDTRTLFQALLERYDMWSPRTDRPTVIGNKDTNARKCRFCGETKADGANFKSAAHAIPTALGNDFLKLADECDECNGYFGRETETSLIAMLDVQRAFLGTQGRGKNNGRPKLEFSEGKLFHDGARLNIQAEDVVNSDGHFSFDLGARVGASVVPMAIYRALVKILLSVIDVEDLSHLKHTIEWVRYGKHADQRLPTVASAIINLPPDPSAQITVYRRKSEDSRLPHLVGEFRLGCFVYVFAVPFSDRDKWDLVGYFEEPEFKETFKHYQAVERWSQNNFNGVQKVFLSPQIKLVPRQLRLEGE